MSFSSINNISEQENSNGFEQENNNISKNSYETSYEENSIDFDSLSLSEKSDCSFSCKDSSHLKSTCLSCPYQYCIDCCDIYTNAGNCKICGVFICEECQCYPDGWQGQDHDECICPECLFTSLKKILNSDPNKKISEQYIKKYIIDVKNENKENIEKYLCKHFLEKNDQKKIFNKNFDIVPFDYDENCYKCLLNSCIYGCRCDLYFNYFEAHYNELF